MKRKIMIVSCGLGNGGSERVASIIASGLCKKGYEVLFLAIYNGDKVYELDSQVKYRYIDVENRNKISKYISRLLFIRKEMNTFKPDCIISFLAQEMLLVNILQKYKIIYSERTDPSSEPLRMKILKRILYSSSTGVVFQTTGARDFFGIDIQDKSCIIANPIDDSLPIWNFENHKKSIVTACRISREKNLEMLIKAFSVFSTKHPDYLLKIYGKVTDNNYYDELLSLLETYNISKMVEFCGFHVNISQQEIECEMFVLTSNFEGLSNSMLEALCMGIPTICTDCPCGGAAMYIKDGENGYLVGVNNARELADKMELLADSPEMQQKFSINAQKLRTELNRDMIVEKWEQIINSSEKG